VPWIKNVLTNPGAGTVAISFRVYTGSTPHAGLVGVYGIVVSSTVAVQIAFRRKNELGTQTYDNLFRVVCPANATVYLNSDDAFIQAIGVPEAGAYEVCEAYVVAAVTGTVFIAVKVAGGPVEVVTGGVA
jgi:hypothetical protein